jgi:hypothetical protein
MSERPTSGPYAVHCRHHGQVFLTEKEYNDQLLDDSFWVCPICGAISSWDDDNYEKYTETAGMWDV